MHYTYYVRMLRTTGQWEVLSSEARVSAIPSREAAVTFARRRGKEHWEQMREPAAVRILEPDGNWGIDSVFGPAERP